MFPFTWHSRKGKSTRKMEDSTVAPRYWLQSRSNGTVLYLYYSDGYTTVGKCQNSQNYTIKNYLLYVNFVSKKGHSLKDKRETHRLRENIYNNTLNTFSQRSRTRPRYLSFPIQYCTGLKVLAV